MPLTRASAPCGEKKKMVHSIRFGPRLLHLGGGEQRSATFSVLPQSRVLDKEEKKTGLRSLHRVACNGWMARPDGPDTVAYQPILPVHLSLLQLLLCRDSIDLVHRRTRPTDSKPFWGIIASHVGGQERAEAKMVGLS